MYTAVYELDAQPTQHSGHSSLSARNVEYCILSIVSVLWFCRNVCEVSARIGLHPGTQSAVDGKRQGLEAFKSTFQDP